MGLETDLAGRSCPYANHHESGGLPESGLLDVGSRPCHENDGRSRGDRRLLIAQLVAIARKAAA